MKKLGDQFTTANKGPQSSQTEMLAKLMQPHAELLEAMAGKACFSEEAVPAYVRGAHGAFALSRTPDGAILYYKDNIYGNRHSLEDFVHSGPRKFLCLGYADKSETQVRVVRGDIREGTFLKDVEKTLGLPSGQKTDFSAIEAWVREENKKGDKYMAAVRADRPNDTAIFTYRATTTDAGNTDAIEREVISWMTDVAPDDVVKKTLQEMSRLKNKRGSGPDMLPSKAR